MVFLRLGYQLAHASAGNTRAVVSATQKEYAKELGYYEAS